MPRRARLTLPNIQVHIIQRGNNRQVRFFADEDSRFDLDWLRQYAAKLHCGIHAYVLMTNHVHLLLTSERADGAGVLMKALGQRYVQYVDRKARTVHREGLEREEKSLAKERRPCIRRVHGTTPR